MKPNFSSTICCLIFFAQLALAQENSLLFSLYAGAPTATIAFSGTDASEKSEFFTECTNYLHGLYPVTSNPKASTIPQGLQVQVDDVCEFCSSAEISRIDSCCAQPTSVACFQQFAAQTTAAGGVPATAANPAATITGASTPANTKTSNGNRFDVDFLTGPILMTMFGYIAWAL